MTVVKKKRRAPRRPFFLSMNHHKTPLKLDCHWTAIETATGLPLDCHWTAIGLPLFWAPRTAPAAWHYHLNQPTRWGHFCLCCSWWNSTPKCPIARRINSDRAQACLILCLRVKLQASVNYLVAILLGQAPRNRSSRQET